MKYYGDFILGNDDAVITFGISPSGVHTIFWLNIWKLGSHDLVFAPGQGPVI